jgi:hypothetical protein
MQNISYDTKPFPGQLKRIRLNVIDSFINEEKQKVIHAFNKIFISGRSFNKEKLKKLFHYSMKVLEDELEKKRLFQIQLKGILSFRRPESIQFINDLNNYNKLPTL